MKQKLTSSQVMSELGLAIRPYAGEDDVAHMVAILNRELEADGVPGRESEGEMRAWVRHPSESFDASRDVEFAEVDGKPVAFTDRSWVDTNDGLREYRINGAVLPEFRRQGIGTVLVERNERRARELAAIHRSERPQVIGSWANDRQVGRVALLRENGFEPVRWFFDMTRDLFRGGQ